MRRRVDLPAPFSPRMTVEEPDRKGGGDVAQGGEGAVDLGDGVEACGAAVPSARIGVAVGMRGSAANLLASIERAAQQRISAGCGKRGGRCRGLLTCGCGSVLGGAFGLKLRGVEDAVVAVGSDGERLSVVLEGVGWGLGALYRRRAACWPCSSRSKVALVPTRWMLPGATLPATRRWRT